jgi:hypothetical protein
MVSAQLLCCALPDTINTPFKVPPRQMKLKTRIKRKLYEEIGIRLLHCKHQL